MLVAIWLAYLLGWRREERAVLYGFFLFAISVRSTLIRTEMSIWWNVSANRPMKNVHDGGQQDDRASARDNFWLALRAFAFLKKVTSRKDGHV